MTFDPTVRPRVHFTPRRNWMNDPNGLIFHEGEYHLFFQHSAHSVDPERASWGHAVSTDLVSWAELPVAIPATAEEHVLSGSVVIDHDNRSGLGSPGRPPMIAMYTALDPETGIQRQSLASSTDRGRTWTRYSGNPVLDIGSTDFRDPKMIRRGDAWSMVLALAEDRQVRFYGSADLIRWEHLSDAGPFGFTEGVWECPDVIEVPIEGADRTAWVILLSVQSDGPAGGSGMQYLVGDFDGARFLPSTAARWFDYGADCYAAVSYAAAPGRLPLVQGWMNNWAYAVDVPAVSFRGSMTLPRHLQLRPRDGELRLVQRPVVADAPVVHRLENDQLDGRRELPCATAARIVAELALGTADRVGLEVRVGEGECTRIVVDRASATISVDRTRSGTTVMPAGFAAIHAAPLPAGVDGALRLDICVDVASVEVFAADGEVVLTDQIFPSTSSTGLAVFAEGGVAIVELLTVALF